MSINKVFVVGNITRDPEKRTAGETSLIQFGIAVNEFRGEKQYANFFDVTVWGNRAKALAGILKKGMKVAIDGSLRYETWEKDGEKRSKVSITAQQVEWFAPKQEPITAPADDIPW